MTVRFHLSRTRLIVAVMILAFAWLSPPALANSLTTQANVGSSGGACPGAAYDFETTKPASSSCFFGFNGAPGGIPDNTAGQGFAQSFANYGVLRGFASVAISSLRT